MSLQDIFYISAITMMGVTTLVLITLVVILIYIQRKVSHMSHYIEVNVKKAEDIVKHPGAVAKGVATAVMDSAVTQVTNMVTKKGRKRLK